MQVISFDFWNTIATANPQYKEERNRYLTHVMQQAGDVVEARYESVKSQLDKGAAVWGAAVTPLEAVKKLVEPFKLPQGITAYEIHYNLQLLAKRYPPSIVNVHLLESLRTYSSLFLVCNTNFIASGTIREWLKGYPFARMFFSDELGVSKPSRDIFSAVLFHASQIIGGIAPSSITHVGDNGICDIKGATDVGFSAVKVASPRDTERWIKEQIR